MFRERRDKINQINKNCLGCKWLHYNYRTEEPSFCGNKYFCLDNNRKKKEKKQ